MPTIHSALPPATLKHEDTHNHRRRFIGPMPVKVLATKDTSARKRLAVNRHFNNGSSDEDEEEQGLRDVIRQHALQFFLRHGGNKEDWDEGQEQSAREEMLRRWRESDWRKVRKQRQETKSTKRWIGSSFDVGSFLGVNILDFKPLTLVASPTDVGATNTSTAAADTFVTALSHAEPSTVSIKGGRFPPPLAQRATEPPLSWHVSQAYSTNSSTALLNTNANEPAKHSDNARIGPVRPGLQDSLLPSAFINNRARKSKSTSHIPSAKSNGKAVHYSDIIQTPEEPPAPPNEVLARVGSDIENTSAISAAARQAVGANQTPWGDVIMRDRMLVRMSHSEFSSVGTSFDEIQNRTTQHMRSADWEEYIVAWRKDRLEIYKDHSTPGKEWFTGHKHLSFIIPFDQPSTHLSLYSFVDMTFCLVCPPTPLNTHSRKFHHTTGTNVFVFKVKSRTRAIDWFWRIWYQLGGEVPPFIEIHCPSLNTRVKIDIPSTDGRELSAAFPVFERRNITNLCKKSLCTVQDYDVVIARVMAEGSTMELAWRWGTNLDWVWQCDDVEGKYRDWAILCGVAMTQHGKPAHLEVRLKQHLPTRLHLKDGTRLDEPPAIEGYLERVKPNSQLKQLIYLTTHDGYLFALTGAHANPPAPPDIPLADTGLNGSDTLREAEVMRGARQILAAIGMTDLRNVVAVRRAFQLLPSSRDDGISSMGRETSPSEDMNGFWDHAERSVSDDEDEGGPEILSKSRDKGRLRMRRSFELLLASGYIVRFEAYSCQVALEWIVQLRPLISYWRKRHQIDAQREMNLSHFGTGQPLVTPVRHRDESGEDAPESPPNPDAPPPDLSVLFNWCVLENCRPILKCGKLFTRKGLRGQYKQVILVLLPGHLVQFRVSKGTSMHHRRHVKMSLLDAYVCSGYFAAAHLPEGQYNLDAPPAARRYQDGLETDDCEEDTLFMIWYRETNSDGKSNAENITVPPLTAKRKLAVFRARGKLERDAWCWAINSEIEKIVRAAQKMEIKVRETGELIAT